MAVRLRDNRRRALSQVENDVAKEVTRLALLTERFAKQSMLGGGKPHQPSRPGEPPRVDTGRLRASITHEVQGVVARVGTNVGYGLDLEVGNRGIEPRPWLRPALRKASAAPRTNVSTRITQ